jgi:DNA-binding transcriptional ArsR family regulator
VAATSGVHPANRVDRGSVHPVLLTVGHSDRRATPAKGLDALLTCDRSVTYSSGMTDDDRVFRALADPTRRFLLDLLFLRDGRTLTELEMELEMTRFGVMKHLRILEDAGLVVTQRAGREKRHFLNPVPIRLIHDRWIDKYTERQVSALADLKNDLEGTA